MINYVENVVNYFNNLKGYMDYNEMYELIKHVAYSQEKQFSLKQEIADKINKLIEADKGQEAYFIIIEKCLIHLGGK